MLNRGGVALVLGALCLCTVASAQERCVDQSQRDESVYMKNFGQTDCAQSFQQASDGIEGAALKTLAGIGTPGSVTIELWDNLPNQGGNMLATGTDPDVNPGEWATCEFGECVSVTPGRTYFLRFLNSNNDMGITGCVTDCYPFGDVYANPGYNRFPGFDYTFETFCCQGPPTPRCIYQVSKVKNKANACGQVCDACPYVRGDLVCTIECRDGSDCPTRLRGFNACPNGGACKVSADLVGCDIPPQNCKRCR
ncbi:MAG: hypothetical protein FLDDKLPJ_01513 [Phycisphaerae bacterium]|nr:hypothetical protein [Phycisphaerae bacterium]